MSPLATADPAAADVLRRSRDYAKALSLPDPEFEYRLAWADTYEQHFAGLALEETEVGAVLERVFRTGRLILLGRGGTGKTVVLRRLVKLAAAEDNVALYVSLRDWTGADYDLWRDLSDDSSRIAFVLKRLTRPPVQLLDFEYLPLAKKCLFVDGLNEVNTVVGMSPKPS